VLDARERAKRGEKGIAMDPAFRCPAGGGCDPLRLDGPAGSRSPRQLPHRTILEVGPQSTFHTIEGNYRDQVAWVWRDLNFVQASSGFRSMPPFHLSHRRSTCPGRVFVDPKNGNKVLAKPTGEFFNYDATGKPGGEQVARQPRPVQGWRGPRQRPCVAIQPWDDGGPFSGIVAFCVDSAGKVHPYAFPSNGTYGYAKK